MTKSSIEKSTILFAIKVKNLGTITATCSKELLPISEHLKRVHYRQICTKELAMVQLIQGKRCWSFCFIKSRTRVMLLLSFTDLPGLDTRSKPFLRSKKVTFKVKKAKTIIPLHLYLHLYLLHSLSVLNIS